MPKTSEMHNEGKFLKKEDIGRGVLATVKTIVKRDVSAEGSEEQEQKWCLIFHELQKPLVLNQTNIQLCEEVFASDDTDRWIGKAIVLYTDPNVMYAGKRVGGIRVRKPKPGAAPPPPAVLDTELTADDIPF